MQIRMTCRCLGVVLIGGLLAGCGNPTPVIVPDQPVQHSMPPGTRAGSAGTNPMSAPSESGQPGGAGAAPGARAGRPGTLPGL